MQCKLIKKGNSKLNNPFLLFLSEDNVEDKAKERKANTHQTNESINNR